MPCATQSWVERTTSPAVLWKTVVFLSVGIVLYIALHENREIQVSPDVLYFNASLDTLFDSSLRRSQYWNYHENKTLDCGAPPKEGDSKWSVETPFVSIPRSFGFGGGFHEMQYNRHTLASMQTCVYANLFRWWKLCEELLLEAWSVQAGSFAGLLCYQGLIPWDDDLDLYVFNDECDKITSKFESLNFSTVQVDGRFETRMLDDSFELLRMHAWIVSVVNILGALGYGTAGYPAGHLREHLQEFYKLRHVKQPFSGDVLGIDIICVNLQANKTRLHTLPFGPLQAKVHDHPLVFASCGRDTVLCVA